MKKWHLEVRPISSLTPHPRNARQLSKDEAKHLKASLKKFGIIDKPVITDDGKIIGGHQRVAIMKELGYKNAECWVSEDEWTDEDIDELNIRLNRNTGSWDWDKLANEWDVKNLLDWGFTESELQITVPDGLDDEGDKKNKITICPACGHEF